MQTAQKGALLIPQEAIHHSTIQASLLTASIWCTINPQTIRSNPIPQPEHTHTLMYTNVHSVV